jgi:penicillin-binding protein 2
MLLRTIADFFKEAGSNLKRILSSRIIPFVLVAITLFGVIIYRLFYLQIIKGETFTNSYTMKTQREETIPGTRGNIYDRNGKLLAYSELAYSVIIEDCGYYDSSKIKHATLNSIIAQTINIIESNGDKINFDFPIEYTSYHVYRFTSSGNTLLRFFRDIYGKQAVSQLSEEEKNSSPDDVIRYFKDKYQVSDEYSNDLALKIIYIRYNLAANSYKRYIPFTVAQNVSKETMAAILESSSELVGVNIAEESVRKYNYSTYLAHIIGYTGKINETELETLNREENIYSANDVVGKSGIESVFETVLAGKKGLKTMLVDNVGRVQEITGIIESQVGNDVYLTIDAELQKNIYNMLERRLAEVLITNTVETDDTHAGLSNDVVMPITRVYFALIDNNVISMKKISSSKTDAGQYVYSIFSKKKEEVLGTLETELLYGTKYSLLSDEMKSYVKRVRSLLLEMDILNADKIKSSDELSQKWSAGEISLREYLAGAINNGWVNIDNLDVSVDYPTTDEVIKVVTELTLSEIKQDEDLDKLIYRTLILNRVITGKYVCLMLMEQNAVEHTESEYVSIQNGASPYDFIRDKILNLKITPAQLALDPCSGSCVMEDPNTGEIIAMVSYPSYDINLFSGSIDPDYYKQLLADKSTPLVNRATHTKIAPGSTFKPLTGIAALTEGSITSGCNIYCSGIFDSVVPNIKCWCYPNEHGSIDTEKALEVSCNAFFCELGYRFSLMDNGKMNHELGLSKLEQYTKLLGLSTKTGIQLPETIPHASDYDSVASSIGQGTNAYTSLNLARYASTIANRGTVYNSNLLMKVVSSDGTIIQEGTSVIASKAENISDATWSTVQNGMGRVISNGALNVLMQKLPVKVSAKSGTAQEDKTRGNHACYIMFTQDENGEADVVTSVMLPYAYAAANAGIMAYYALSCYYGVDVPQSVFFDTDTNIIINE